MVARVRRSFGVAFAALALCVASPAEPVRSPQDHTLARDVFRQLIETKDELIRVDAFYTGVEFDYLYLKRLTGAR